MKTKDSLKSLCSLCHIETMEVKATVHRGWTGVLQGARETRLAAPTVPSMTGLTEIHPVIALSLSHCLCFFCNNLSLYPGLHIGSLWASQSMDILLILKYFWLQDFN